MIMSKPDQKQSQQTTQKKPAARPNEHGSIVVQAHMKIFDPNTNKVYVEGRA